eukprot:TRINITY_DN3014_c0_g1_i1.p1 TRINITY_DN3014_c0_g1~~TRINITY_DN3014_c0_g1_i1.p1  ORF type:complete len:400 (+),score=107.37 TRINITY_DN3014_c0_g1_i1:57-1256(+)
MADYHHFNVNGSIFQVPRRYDCESALGSGAFGVVCSASDNDNGGNMVAIKKLSKPFHDEYSAVKLVRELRLLKHFAGHESIVGLLDILKPQTEDYEDVYVVTDLMDCDLKYCLKNKSQDLGQDHYQYFLSQILNGVHAMHSANVLHRDLKPENIFVKADCTLKIGDLGLARESSGEMSQYVVTRWYRAPELIMNWQKYGCSIDIWSVGCIFAEMISVNHRPIFPGVNPRQQLDLILRVVGRPSEEDYAFVTSETAKKYLQNSKYTTRADLIQTGFLPPDTTEQALDFLYKSLHFNPQKRPTALELKSHPYIWDEEEEEEEEFEDVPPFNSDFMKHVNSIDDARQVVNVMVKHYHPDFEGPSHPHVTADTMAGGVIDEVMFTANDEEMDLDETLPSRPAQ